MDKLTQIALLLVEFFSYFYILIVMLRFLLQLVRADFYNPLSQFIVKATNPLVIPLRKVIPGLFGIDIASLVLAIALQILAFLVMSIIANGTMIPFVTLSIGSVLKLIELTLNIYFFSFIIMVIISWIAPNTHNPVMAMISSLTEPVLRPLRKTIPSMGGLDFSVMVAMLGIFILKILFGFS
ncbi:MAG: YggT family protein [Cellvibrionaceae bacterium]|jgi:YggT family protein